SNPEAYGVAEFDGENIKSIVEKPTAPVSDAAVTGLYMYDPQVFDVIKGLSPSQRNELEITDVNNFYLEQGTLSHRTLDGFWGDSGESFDSLMEAAGLIRGSHLRNLNDHLDVDDRTSAGLADESVNVPKGTIKSLFS
ncbi:hypothetical protein HON58_03015, partial [Candidatus Peregrinibacteria bacterium]|nr:hypothetical protein [Candidatus Peregrinibacteria bacterium]